MTLHRDSKVHHHDITYSGFNVGAPAPQPIVPAHREYACVSAVLTSDFHPRFGPSPLALVLAPQRSATSAV